MKKLLGVLMVGAIVSGCVPKSSSSGKAATTTANTTTSTTDPVAMNKSTCKSQGDFYFPIEDCTAVKGANQCSTIVLTINGKAWVCYEKTGTVHTNTTISTTTLGGSVVNNNNDTVTQNHSNALDSGGSTADTDTAVYVTLPNGVFGKGLFAHPDSDHRGCASITSSMRNNAMGGDNGTAVVYANICVSAYQTWDFVRVGSSHNKFTIQNHLSHRCLDVPGNSKSSATALQEWDCNGSPQQVWELTSMPSRAGGTKYQIKGHSSGLCLSWNPKDTRFGDYGIKVETCKMDDRFNTDLFEQQAWALIAD